MSDDGPAVKTTIGSITVRPFTHATFAQFGSVIEDPSNDETNPCHGQAQSGNQDTCHTYTDIARPYDTIDQSTHKKTGRHWLRTFVCHPRKPQKPDTHNATAYPLTHLERHRYTTQIFIPIGLSREAARRTAYLVIVAPDLPDCNGPDVDKAEAFFVHGGQGVMYGHATWHAPMMAIGDGDVTFIVSQTHNDVIDDEVEVIRIDQEMVIHVPDEFFDPRS